MRELDRINVKTELYEFAEKKLEEYGENCIDLAVLSFLEVATELGINIYGIDNTMTLISQLQRSLDEMKQKTAFTN